MNINEYTPFPCIVFLNRNHACSYWQLVHVHTVHVYIHILLTMSIIHRWEQQHTTGTPPPGVWGYGSCSSGKDIYYFGGYCGHSSCRSQLLVSFECRRTLLGLNSWPPTDKRGPMQKDGCALLAFDDQVLAFGGFSLADPSNPFSIGKV